MSDLIIKLTKIFIIIIVLASATLFLINVKDKNNNYQKNEKTAPQPEESVRIIFVGDIMLDRSIRKKSEILGYDHYFGCASSTLKSFDLAVANMESAITNYASESMGKSQDDPRHFKFTTDPIALSAIRKAGIDALGIDNNHIFDFGTDGVMQTAQQIESAGLKYFGHPSDEDAASLFLRTNDVAFTLVSFNEFFGQADQTVTRIKEANNDYPIIVFAHWGDEYVAPPERVRKWARLFIDSGADLIVGMHPHILQESDQYLGKNIYYSLGNFIFDQYFSEEVMRGGAVEVVINKEGIVSSKLREVTLDADKRPCIN